MVQKTKKELNENFINACRKGDLEKVQYLLTSPDLKEYADIHVENDYGFRCSCWNGHFEIVKYLLTSPDLKEHADIHSHDDLGFQWACMRGHLEIVKYLLASPGLTEHTDIHADNDSGLVWACQYGHLGVVQYLINETEFGFIDNIRKIEFYENSKISKNDVLDMAKSRDLKNQLSSLVSSRDSISEKPMAFI